MTVDMQRYSSCVRTVPVLENISFQAPCYPRKSGLCDGSFFNAVGEKSFSLGRRRRRAAWVFQHCARQAYAKMTLLRVVVHYWYFFLYGTSLCNAYNGGWLVGLVFRRSSLFCFLPSRFCSLHFNNDVHFYVVRQKEGRG